MAKNDLILLTLDPSPVLDLMERTLTAAGFGVAVVHDRLGMEKSIQEAIPALMIIGEKFSGEDGFSISREILERFPTLPIILYADKDTNGLARSVLKMGMSGYLCPPLKMSDITDEVQRSLARARKLGDWLRREVKRTTSSLAEKADLSEAEHQKLEAIIANIQDGVIVMDRHRNIILVNRAVSDIFDLDDLDLVGRSVIDAIPNEDLQALLARATNGPLKYHEVNFNDGRVYNAQYTPIPHIGGAITMQDISYLKELDRLKSDFIHTISHDLRSPLTAIMGYTELVERTGPLTHNQQEFLRRLQGSAQHITTLVNDLLDLGRLDAGFDTRRETVHLDNVLKYSLDIFDNQVKKKNIKLSVNVAPNLKALRANPIRIRQMLDNLVGNAIKYTPTDGSVHVSMSMEGEQIIIKVKDTGVGIPPEEQGRVFEKFYRASNAARGAQGSGLGLAIVKSIVDSHQGRVWVESTVGKGSTFIVLLPTQE
ncbi:two-component system, OmpR family, sensor histidine kinase VicK [Anaerolineales bacterium]|nr:two-component system, OmpR family, sensor histidine kinase VicK [Anaerolineales bacterium]